MNSSVNSERSWLPAGWDATQVKTAIDAELARRDLLEFARFLSPPSYVWNWHHEVLYRRLQAFARGDIKRLIVEMPPGHGKSEGVSRNLPAYLFGLNPDTRVIACSYTLDLASEMNRDVQRLMDSPAYAQVFPAVHLGKENVRALAGKPRRNSDIFDIPGARGFYKAAGVGVGIGGRRFDRGIIDDPIKDREEANSSAHRERVWRWFTSTFYNRQARGAGICVTSTRWHEDDLVGRIKRKVAAGEMEPWEVLTLPAIATDDRHPEDPRQPGEALWPWLRPVEELERMRTLEPRDFYALQQQDPRGEGSTEWPADLFIGQWFDDWPEEIELLVIALDPSKGRNESADYSALVTLARTRDGRLWVDADLARRGVVRIVTDGIAWARQMERETDATLEGFGVESDQFQELLANDFVRETAAAGISLPIYKITTGGIPKEVRIRRISTHITNRQIHFRNTPGARLLVRQLEQFPHGDHDDGPDALEMTLRLAKKLYNRGR